MTAKVPYTISHRESGFGYDVLCLLCSGTSKCWDYKRNAVWASRSHIQTEHPEFRGLPKVGVLNAGPWSQTVANKENK